MGAWCSTAWRRSSSAISRSASGRTRSMPTSRRRRSIWRPTGPPDVVLELGEILPSLRPSGVGRGESVADERYRSHRAIRMLLALLAADRPLVLVLDDLHWSDAASIELIAALLRRGPRAPVLFALALPAEPGARPPVGRARGALGPPDRARRAQRGAGGGAAGRSRTGERSPPSTATAAATRSTSSSSRAPARKRGVTAAPGGNGAGNGVPAAVAASLAEELASLSGKQRALLDAAAVAGEPFEPGLAAAIAELSSADGLAALDALLALDLVRPTPVPRRFIFRHPLVRRAVLESAPGGWKLAAHARAAAALAARGAAAAECAHHVEHSASPGDEQAIALLLHAGAATAPRAPAVAAHWFEAALRLLPAEDRERQVDVRVDLARTLRSLGELERCRETLLDALAAASRRRARAPGRADRALRGDRALARSARGRPSAPGARVGRAARPLDAGGGGAADRADGGRPLRARLRADGGDGPRGTRGVACDGRPRPASPRPRRRWLSARPPRDRSARRASTARRRLALVDRLSGRRAGAPAGDAVLPRLGGELPRALRRRRRARGPRHRDRPVHGRGTAAGPDDAHQGLHVRDAGARGRRDRALRDGRRGDAALGQHRTSSSWALCELAFAHYHAGRPRGRDRGRRGERAGRRAPGRRHDARRRRRPRLGARHVALRGGRDRARQGDHALARQRRPAAQDPGGEVLRLGGPRARRARARTQGGRRRLCASRRGACRACSACACRPPSPSVRGRPSCSPTTSRWRRPSSRSESAEVAAAAGARLPAAFSLALAGRALVAGGEREEAIAVLRRAESELDACGSMRVRDEMRRELRRLGVRTEPPRPSRPPRSGSRRPAARAARHAGRSAAGGARQGARRPRAARRPRGSRRHAAGTRRRSVRRARRAGRPPVRGTRLRRLAG